MCLILKCTYQANLFIIQYYHDDFIQRRAKIFLSMKFKNGRCFVVFQWCLNFLERAGKYLQII